MIELPLYSVNSKRGTVRGQGDLFHGAVGDYTRKVDVRLLGKGNSKLAWRKAGPPNHLDDKVVSDQ